MSIPTEYYKTVRKNPSLVCYWRLNDLTGTRAIDWSGKYNLNGIYNGSPVSDIPLILNDNISGSKLFGSENQNIEVPDAVPLHISKDLTIEAWIIILSSGQTCSLISKMNIEFTKAKPYYLGLENGKIIFKVGNIVAENSIISSEIQSINIPLHVIVTKYKKILKIYINGKENSSKTFSGLESPDAARPLYMGEKGNNSFRFNGMIGEVAIYSGALGSTEIQNHFNIGRQIIFKKPYYTTFDRPSYS